MSLLAPATIEDMILARLQHGPLPTHELLGDIDARRRGVTKQGFYAALRKLKSEESVVIYKKTVALNTLWIGSMQALLSTMSRSYTQGGDGLIVLNLAEREHVSFTFLNTRHLDTFWGHAQNILLQITTDSEPIYAYDPHYWFYIAREKTESKLLSHVVAKGRQFLMAVGGNAPLDRAIRNGFATESLQYHFRKHFAQKNYYVTVIGDYITEVFLDQRVAAQVERIYASVTRVDAAAVEQLDALLAVRSKNRIRITRNSVRARQLKAKLGKDFFIRH